MRRFVQFSKILRRIDRLNKGTIVFLEDQHAIPHRYRVIEAGPDVVEQGSTFTAIWKIDLTLADTPSDATTTVMLFGDDQIAVECSSTVRQHLQIHDENATVL